MSLTLRIAAAISSSRVNNKAGPPMLDHMWQRARSHSDDGCSAACCLHRYERTRFSDLTWNYKARRTCKQATLLAEIYGTNEASFSIKQWSDLGFKIVEVGDIGEY